VKAAQKSKQLV